MTTLADVGGRFFRSAGPSRYQAVGQNSDYGLPGLGRPLWTAGDQIDEYGYHDTSGRHITFEGAYLSFPAVHAVVNKLVRQAATIPLKIYDVDSDGQKHRVRAGSLDRGADLANLLKRPSPRRSSVHLKQWIMLPSTVYGNGLLAKWRGAGKNEPPTELMPMEWKDVCGYAPQGGAIEVWGTIQLGSERFVAVEDTIHFAWEACGQLGSPPLKALRDTLRLENAAVRTQTASFRNGPHTSGFVVPGDVQTVTVETLREMRRQIEEAHAGPDNAFKVAALAPGSDWKPLTFDSKEAELMATRVFNRIDVCAAYDMKPPVVGYIEQANYASIKEINQDFYRTTLRPWLTLVEETIQAQLIDPEPAWQGLTVEFDMREQLKGSPLEEAQRLKTEFEIGGATPNENRDVLNKPRFDNPLADEPWFQTNNAQPVSQVGQQLALPIPPQGG